MAELGSINISLDATEANQTLDALEARIDAITAKVERLNGLLPTDKVLVVDPAQLRATLALDNYRLNRTT